MSGQPLAVALSLFGLAGLATAALVGPSRSDPHVTVLCDLLDEFPAAERINAPSVELHRLARTHAQVLPSISLHPTGEGDTIVRYRLDLPRLGPGERLLALMQVAMSDGIPWDNPLEPNGVRFTVAAEGETLWEEDVRFTGWQWRAVELTSLAGRTVALDLRSNAIGGNAAYDWFLVARPRVVRFRGANDASALADNASGYGVARVRSDGPARVHLSAGGAVTEALVPAGTHCLAVRFDDAAPASCEAVDGTAEVLSIELAPASYGAKLDDLAASQALLIAGQPFDVYLPLTNPGDGTYPGGDVAVLQGAGTRRRAVSPPVRPSGEGVVHWTGLRFDHAGRYHLAASLDGQRRELEVTVLPAVAWPDTSPGEPEVRTLAGHPAVGLAGNPHARVCVLVGTDGSAGAVAQTWDGRGWQTVATVAPLARLQVAAPGGSQEVPLRFRAPQARGDLLVVTGDAVGADGATWTVRLTLKPDPEAPRLHWDCQARCDTNAELLGFTSPELAAGEGAFGERKEFALFPGVEYLEGDETSSSPRDLAPPLNDRRAPRADKIAVPLMAAQGGGALVGLLWDMQQKWSDGQSLPAARFNAPAFDSGPRYVRMALSAPGIGPYVPENAPQATKPYPLAAGQNLRLQSVLVLDHHARYQEGRVAKGPHRGSLLTQAFQHWVDVFGLPPLQPLPRSWEAERELCREAFLNTLWSEDPPGWPPCAGQPVGYDTEALSSLSLELQAGVDADTRAEIERRCRAVAERALRDKGPGSLLQGNRVLLPFHYGYLAESLRQYRGLAQSLLGGREDGLWVWRPGDAEHAGLGVPGTHTLGQAAYPCLVVLRAARFLGDSDLTREALQALRQMEQYEVPRGASMWECPQYQPDLFAAALAIKAYVEAYRLTGDTQHLAHARYWAWTGLPFVYTWSLDGYPTMLYNTVGVIGSTYYTHSWIGRPLIWMGMDYAYALQDLAPHDNSFAWLQVAEGITRSATWQQYAEGPSKGLFPDSWEMATNTPNPADILPNLILLNGHRLRGLSLETRFARVGEGEAAVHLNSSADIVSIEGGLPGDRVSFTLAGVPGFPAHSVLAPVDEPAAVEGAGDRAASDAELQERLVGWLYDAELRALVLKQTPGAGPLTTVVHWRTGPGG